jgi:hypothetical protein
LGHEVGDALVPARHRIAHARVPARIGVLLRLLLELQGLHGLAGLHERAADARGQRHRVVLLGGGRVGGGLGVEALRAAGRGQPELPELGHGVALVVVHRVVGRRHGGGCGRVADGLVVRGVLLALLLFVVVALLLLRQPFVLDGLLAVALDALVDTHQEPGREAAQCTLTHGGPP